MANPSTKTQNFQTRNAERETRGIHHEVPRSAFRVPHLTWLALAALVVMLPAFWYGVPNGADLTNHLRLGLPFYDALASGQLGPGWLAESNNGWGDARFRFYPPGFFYLWAALRWLCGNWHTATLAGVTLLTIGRGWGVYLWARAGGLSPRAAFYAGLAIIFAPFALNEFYQAAFIPEHAAVTILPFIFCAVENIIRRESWRDVAALAAALALLIVTHLPLLVIGGLALAAYTLLRLKSVTEWRALARLASGVGLGLIVSAPFWVTMFAELALIKGNGIAPNPYYDYRNNFLFSPFALANINTWFASALGVVTVLFFAPALVLWQSRDRHSAPRLLKALAVVCLAAFLMTTDLSRPVWRVVPKLSEVQFPARWLAIVSLCGALLFGAALEQWLASWRNFQPRHWALALGFALALVFTAHQIVFDTLSLTPETMRQLTTAGRYAPSFKDWLPVAALEAKNMPALPAQVEADGRQVTMLAWSPERRIFRVAGGNAGPARVKTYYYPHWQAFTDTQTLATRPDEYGALLVDLPAETATVTVAFTEPPRSRIAFIAAIAGWLLIAGLTIKNYELRITSSDTNS